MTAFNFDPFPVLETPRVILREVMETDVSDLFVLRANPQLMHFIPRPIAQTEQDALDLILKIKDGIRRGESINWAISLREEKKLLGLIGFVRTKSEHYRGEVGYILHGDYQGKGIMHEALSAVVDYGFEQMRLHSIEAIVDPENSASWQLLERNQFVREGHLRESEFYKGRFNDIFIYSRLTPFARTNEA
jgi:ribosomal-protein-alanine N-acetyltransferase